MLDLRNDEGLREAIEAARQDAGPDGFVFVCYGKPWCHVNYENPTPAEEAIADNCLFCYRLQRDDPRDIEEIIAEMCKLQS